MPAPRTSPHDPSARGPDPRARRARRPRPILVAWLAGLAALALPAAPAFGEGSVDVNTGPDTAIRQSLGMNNRPADVFGQAYTVLNVYAQAGETIQLGSSAMGVGAGNILVYAPGTALEGLTFPTDPPFGTDIFDCATDAPAGAGVIATRAEEVAGPQPNAGGYVPCEFDVTTTGIYPVIIGSPDPSQPSGHGGTVAAPNQQANHGVAMWDVTVRDAGDVVHPGRLFSYDFGFGTSSVNTSGAEVFPYTKTGYEYRVSFVDQGGVNWHLRSDDMGVVDAATGERLFASFACGDGSNTAQCQFFDAGFAPPERHYPLFVNRLDPLVISGPAGLAETRGYATAPIAPSSNPLAGAVFTGSAGQPGGTNQGSGGTIAFSSPTQMEGLGYTVLIDTDRNGTFGGGTDFVDDAGDLSAGGSNTFAWNGRDAQGNPPACGDYRYEIRSSLAEIHFALSDVENSGGTEIERLSLATDPALGDAFAASYNDIDPYKNTDVLPDTTPDVVTDGDSSVAGFHAWGNASGDTDFIDTWAKLPEVQTTGTLSVLCPPPPPPPPGSANVTVDKSASTANATVGDTVTYTIVATNNGPATATNVNVRDPIPSRLDAQSASTAQGTCTVTGNDVACALGTMTNGQSVTITVKAVAARTGGTTNTATISSNECTATPCDTDPADVRIRKPRLGLTKGVNKTRLNAGETATYTIRVRNPSERALRNVKVCDDLPSGLVFVKATPKAKLSKGKYCWTVKRLAAGKSRTFRMTVRALVGTSGRKVNTATATSPDARTKRAKRAVRVVGGQVKAGGFTG